MVAGAASMIPNNNTTTRVSGRVIDVTPGRRTRFSHGGRCSTDYEAAGADLWHKAIGTIQAVGHVFWHGAPTGAAPVTDYTHTHTHTREEGDRCDSRRWSSHTFSVRA